MRIFEPRQASQHACSSPSQRMRLNPFDGLFGSKFDILNPRWLLTADIGKVERVHVDESLPEVRDDALTKRFMRLIDYPRRTASASTRRAAS
jgi:hypothetical protein